MTTTTPRGIAAVAHHTGLTQDTLRWYEREGLIPRVPRAADGRRAYDDASVRLVELIVRLRRTAMPVAQIKTFCRMLEDGAPTHGRRMTLLREHRERLLLQLAQLREDLEAVDAKIGHYEWLVAQGLDCAEEPITDPRVRAEQRRLA